VHNASHAHLLNVNRKVSLGRDLIWVIHASEALDLSRSRLGVDATLVGLLGVLEASRNVDKVEVSELLDHLTSVLSGILVWCNRGGNDGGSRAGKLGRNEGNAANVGSTVRAAEAKLGGELVADGLAQKQGDGSATLLVEGDLQGTSNGVLATVLVTGQEHGETLRGSGRVRLSEHLDNLGVGEPLGDLPTSPEARSQLCAGDVQRTDTLRNLVHWAVLVAVGQVGHHLEGDDLDAKLVLVLLHSVLGVVRSVELLSSAVLSGTGVVSANNEVGASVVLTDDGVPDSLTRTAHTHSQRKQTKDRHTVGVAGHESLVDTHTGEVVNVTGLGQTHNGVDEDIGLSVTGSTDSELTVSTVHRVSGLEGNNARPAKLVEVESEFGRGISQRNVIVVLQSIDGVELSADIELLDGVVEVLDGGMLLIATEDLVGLLSLVWLVDIVDGNDRKVAVIAEVAEGESTARSDLEAVNGLLRNIEVDGHGEEVAICKSVVLDDAVVVLLVHETCRERVRISCCANGCYPAMPLVKDSTDPQEEKSHRS
jgi:hypothetical protein